MTRLFCRAFSCRTGARFVCVFLLLCTGAQAATYKIATDVQANGTAGLLITEFAEKVAGRTDGRVTFKIFHNGVLGSQLQYFQQIQRGVIDAGLVNSAALETLIPTFGVVNLPYIFRSAEEYQKVMTSAHVKQALFESASRHHFVPLAFLSSDFRSIYTTRPVKTFTDLQGLKLRTMPSETYIEMLDRFGATPILLPFGELYSGLQQGIVDGAEGGLAGLYQAKFGEVAKYAIVSEQTRLTDFVVTSKKFQQSLSPADLAIVQEEFEIVSLKSVAYAEANEAASIKKAEQEMGVTFIQVDKEAFIAAVAPMYEAARKDEAKRPLLEAIFETEGRKF